MTGASGVILSKEKRGSLPGTGASALRAKGARGWVTPLPGRHSVLVFSVDYAKIQLDIVDGSAKGNRRRMDNRNDTTGPPEEGEKPEITDIDKRHGESDGKGSDNSYEKICSVCRKRESETATVIDMPGGMAICSSCMQKAFDTIGKYGK